MLGNVEKVKWYSVDEEVSVCYSKYSPHGAHFGGLNITGHSLPIPH